MEHAYPERLIFLPEGLHVLLLELWEAFCLDEVIQSWAQTWIHQLLREAEYFVREREGVFVVRERTEALAGLPSEPLLHDLFQLLRRHTQHQVGPLCVDFLLFRVHGPEHSQEIFSQTFVYLRNFRVVEILNDLRLAAGFDPGSPLRDTELWVLVYEILLQFFGRFQRLNEEGIWEVRRNRRELTILA